MRLLAIDSASLACSVALWRDDAVVARRFVVMSRGHAEALMPMIVDVLAEAETSFGDLDRLAVTVGPGSFTGLRAGLAAARGLALVCGLPLTGITTLEAVARGAREAGRDGGRERPCLAVIETRRADLYVQLFAPDGAPLSEPAAVLPDDVASLLPDAPVHVAGNGAHRLQGVIDAIGGQDAAAEWRARDIVFTAGDGHPDAAFVAELAVERPCGAAHAEDGPAPLYIHPPFATRPARQGRLRP